jgi:DNA excision repair protein ERCC-2
VTSDPSWTDIFGHPTPYPEQADGIEAAIEAADAGGFLALEGACGTGKTMLSLTAGIDRVRDPDSAFERVFVLTSVKQQLRQFETDLETINANLPEHADPVSGITLVGKADVCPYARENRAGIDRGTVYERCDGLRERTRNLIGDDGATTAGALSRAARSQQVGLADSGSSGTDVSSDFLTVDGEPTPYPPDTETHGDTEFCPFYAGYLEDLPEDGNTPEVAVPFEYEAHGHVGPDELVRLAASHGSCPHSVMGALVPAVDVVIGNYYHAFDPVTTATFTGALLDESTFVVCDEAHMLEPRVRDLVSDRVADASLRDAVTELTRVIQPLTLTADSSDRSSDDTQVTASADRTETTASADAETIRAELADADVTLEDLERVRAFYADLRDELDRRVTAHLDATRPDWRASGNDGTGHDIPLRDPTEPARDEISRWAERAGYGDRVWTRAPAAGAFVERALDAISDADARYTAPGVGRTIAAWYREDHTTFFRAIRLESTHDETAPADSWRRTHAASLALYNCLPSAAIGDRLAAFGGGVLMSATLEPMDVFREVTGLDHLAAQGRPVVERTHGLPFPPEHRASLAVDAPKFTHANRGAPGEETETRLAYVDATTTVAARDGNILVGTPSYTEARWMAAALEERLDKPVLLDESSDDRETESLKTAFFEGGDKVLVTSLRGTLTEGVDYSGDRLAAAVVCGVPIINTEEPQTKAVIAAYDRRFSEGFETALTVPAVRKARQAVGRVIRGADERGVRVLLDARYARQSWNDVRGYFPAHEREEFQPVTPDMLEVALERFDASG